MAGKIAASAALKAKDTAAAKAAKPAALVGTVQRKPRRKIGVEEAKAAAKMTTAEWRALQKGMPEAWPAPAYMSEQGNGGATCYRDETYEIVTRWTAETKIKYRPHAKAPGSKSHVRYEVYSKAKTVAQALKLGSWPADWCWDYERGFIKVIGPVRDEPLDISKVMDEKALSDVDMAINRWYKRELARNLGLKVSDLHVGKGSGESLIMRAHRLVAQREAKAALAAAEKAGRQIREDEVLTVLRAWAFAKNPNRQNVLPDGQDWVWSDTLGLIRDRVGDIHITAASKTYPEVAHIMNKYLLDRLPAEVKEFKWTSLNVNCNYAAKLHRDGNNFGPSFIKAFGDFTGGQLSYWPEDDRKVDRLDAMKDKDAVQLDLKAGLAMFNGNSAHSVADFQGERYSIVYFTAGCYDKAPEDCKEACRALGMNYPAPDEDPRRLLRAPKGYGGGDASVTPSKRGAPPPFRFYPSAELDVGAAGRRAEKATPSKLAMKRPAPKAAAVAAKKRAGAANA